MPPRTQEANPGLSRLARYKKRLLEESAFIRHYLWQYRQYVAVGLVSLVILDLLEILPPILLKNAVDFTLERRPVVFLGYVAMGYFAVALLQGICRYGWRMYLIRASLFAGRDIRARYAEHLFSLSQSFYDRKRIGDLMSLATNDVEAVRMFLGAGFLVLADAFFYLLSVPIVMFWLSPKLTLMAFLAMPIIPFVVMRNEREIHHRFEKVQACFSRLSAMTQEGLTGVRVVKAFAKEDVLLDRFRQQGEEYVALNLHLARVQTAFGPILDFFMSLGLVLLLWWGGNIVMGTSGFTAGAAVSIGTFVAFQRYIQKMVWPMAALGMGISYYQRSISSSERLDQIFHTLSDVPDPATPLLPPDFKAGGMWRTSGKIEFKNLSFRFPQTAVDVLSGLSLQIASGERVAIVGTVGSGKSALLSLLPRLYPVSRGMLEIDGIDVNDWPIEELRRQVGYVSQDVFLFSETVTENVAFGLHEWLEQPRNPVSIEQATQLAAVHDDVLGLVGSYKTRLGERGVNLSGGQKQRLTIARALAKQPSILVLDDALSSVDVQTEERILQGLRSRPGRNTELIAAHRISTVKDADRIVVLEGGKITQMGGHSELMREKNGLYRKFYGQQQLKEELDHYSENLTGSLAEESRV